MDKLYVNGHFYHQRVTGVQRYAIEVLNGFRRAGYPFEVSKPSSFFSSNKFSQHLWEQFLLPHQLKSDDLLWSPTNTGPAYLNNHVVTLHDIAVFCHPEWFSGQYKRWKKFLIPRMAHHAKGILTVSEFSKQNICKHLLVRPEKVKVVYNGVNTNRFKPAAREKVNRIIHQYNIEQPYLFTLGSLDPRKNLAGLIRAWAECTEDEKLKGYQLVVAGGSHTTFGKMNTDVSSDAIQYLGYVPDEDLPALYSGAVGLIYPSLFEGFGLPVLEAMACGTPVVTSGSSALGEISGNAALKVNPEETASIQNGIMELIESPRLRTQLIERGFKRVMRFDWNRSAKAIYKYLVSQK